LMKIKPGQVYKVDLGIKGKVRYMVVVSEFVNENETFF
jgi:hypothetical protein